MIEIKNISKSFGKKEVLKDINLTIKEKEVVGLLGSNGSGKTTLLEIVIGQIKPNNGEVLVDGSKKTYKKMGIQFQEGYWPKGVTGKFITKYFSNSVDKEKIEELMDLFEVRGFINKDLNSLSGGQKQRLNTMLAVINNPKYICLDEMITGLDLNMQLKLIDYFKAKRKEGTTMIIISHIPEEVEELCTRIIILEEGKIIFDKPTKEVLKEFGTVRKLMIKYYKGELK